MKLQLAQQKHLLEQQQLLAVLQEEYFASKDKELQGALNAKPGAGKADVKASYSPNDTTDNPVNDESTMDLVKQEKIMRLKHA